MGDFLKIALIQIVLLAFQGITYFGVQNLQDEVHDISRSIDKKIPLISQTVLIYITWYILIAVFPFILYYDSSPTDYYIYIVSIVIDIVLSECIYILYPTSFKRPDPPENKLSGRILKLIYKGNYTGKNCLPSMHCSMCFIIIVFVFSCTGLDLWVRIFTGVLAFLIVLSTMTTKQHVVLDVLAAISVAFISICIGKTVITLGGFI